MYKNNHLGKKNKNLPPTSQPKLLRSTKMRSYCADSSGVCNDALGSIIQSVTLEEGDYLDEAVKNCINRCIVTPQYYETGLGFCFSRCFYICFIK